jgi:hypothetical protein
MSENEEKWGPGLDALTEKQQAQVAEFQARNTLDSTANWLKGKGVVVGHNELAQFLSLNELKRHLQSCSEAVDLVVAGMRKREPTISAEELRKYGQRFFVEAAIAGKDSRAWVAVEQAAARREKLDQELKERRAESETGAREGITPEMFEQIERELRLL